MDQHLLHGAPDYRVNQDLTRICDGGRTTNSKFILPCVIRTNPASSNSQRLPCDGRDVGRFDGLPMTEVPFSAAVFWIQALRTEAPAVGKARTSDRPRADLEEWRERTECPCAAPTAVEFGDVNCEERPPRIPTGLQLSK